MNRLRKKTHSFELPEPSALRAVVVDLADSARDFAHDAASEVRSVAGRAPATAKTGRKMVRRSASSVAEEAQDAARRARRSQVGEAIGAGLGAMLPLLPRALARPRRGAHRVAAAPHAVRAHPAVAMGVVVVSAAVTAYAVRAWLQRRADSAEQADADEVGGADVERSLERAGAGNGSASSGSIVTDRGNGVRTDGIH